MRNEMPIGFKFFRIAGYADALHACIGGGGSAMNSSETAHTHFRIDIASTPGYLTA